MSGTVQVSPAYYINTRNEAQFLDIIGFNRYNAWYSLPGRLETIQVNVVNEAKKWHTKHNKPVLMMEYGADTMPGLHIEPEYIWSEEYQVSLLSEHFKAFDDLREMNFFVGEMIWNFADFKTEQNHMKRKKKHRPNSFKSTVASNRVKTAYTRVGGNRKGILTRERQPKAAAFIVRERYNALAELIDGYKFPKNLFKRYVAPSTRYTNRIEL